MRDQNKTKEQLIGNLVELRQRITELEASDTERKRTEKTLQKSELRYRTTINAMGDAIHLVDSDLRLTLANLACQQWAKDFALGTADIVGLTIFEAFPALPDEACDRLRAEYHQVFDTGETLITEESTTLEGREFVTETRKIPVVENGRVSQVVTVIRDITEHKRAEEEVQKWVFKQEVLREAMLALTTTLDRDEVVGRILAQLQKVVPYDTASVQLLRDDHLEIVGGRGFPNLEEVLGVTFDPNQEDNPNREVVRTQASFIVDDAPTVYAEFLRDPHAPAGIRSWLGVPMLVGERLTGMIALDKSDPGFYTQEHAQLAEAFAAQASIAMENAQLFEQARQELAERKQAEEALRESEEKFRNLAEHSPNMIFINKRGKVVYANQRCEEMMGYTTDEFYSADFNFLTLIAPEHRKLVKASFGKHTKGRDVEPYEYTLVTKDGRGIEALLTAKLIDYEGERAILGTVTDITDRKQVEEMLLESEEKYRALAENSLNGIFISDAVRLIYVNPRFCEITGFSEDELLDMSDPVRSLFVPEERERILTYAQNRLGGGSVPADYEARGRRKDGETVWLKLAVSSIIFSGKRMLQGTVEDITRRKRTEERLRLLSSAVEQSTEGIAIGDLEGNLLFVNHAFAAIHGYMPEEIADKHLSIFHTPEQMPSVEAANQQIRETGKFAGEIWHVRRDGTVFPTMMHNSLLRDEVGNPIAMISTLQDITERKRAEVELQTYARQQAALFQVSTDLAAALDEADACREVVRGLHETLGYDYLGLFLVDGSTGERVLSTTIGWPDAPSDWRIPPGQGISERSLLDGQLHYTPDVTRDPHYIPGLNSGAEVDVPIRVGERVVGVLIVESKEPDAFDEGDFAVLTAAANQASVALERAREHQAVREAEARYRSLFDGVPVGISRTTPEGRVLAANLALVEMLGYPDRETLLAVNAADTYADLQDWKQLRALIEREGEVHAFQVRLRCHDGTTIWAESNVNAVRDAGDQVLYYEGTLENITERKRAEEALKSAELEKQIILDSQLEHVVYQDKEHKILWLNQAACESVGMRREALIGRHCYTIWAQRSERCEDCPVALAMETGRQQEMEKETPDGRMWFVRGYPVRNVGGEVVGGIEITRDITERKRAEARVHRLLNQQLVVNKLALALGHLTDLDQIYSTIHEMVQTLIDVDGFIVSYYDREEHLIHTEYVFIHGTVQDVTNFPPILMGKEGKGLQSQVIRKGEPLYIPDFSGTRKHIQTQYTIQLDGSVTRTTEDEAPITNSALLVPMRIGGETVGVMQVHSLRLDAYGQEDIDLVSSLANMAAIAIQNARLLEQTREQAQRVQQIINTVPEGVLLLNADGQVLLANPVAERDLSVLTDARVGDTITHLGNRPLAELLTSPPKGLWHEVKADALHGQKERVFEIIARPMEKGSEPEDWLLVINDVTQQREIEQRVHQQERLAAVGQLAAGIAHDFNNIMATIVLYAQMTARMENLPTVIRERMGTINQQAGHASRLIQQILDFSRRGALERRPLDLALLLKDHVRLLKRTLPESIEVQLTHGLDEYMVHADPTRMQQVVTNLAVNARDAMPGGGILRIMLERTQVRPGESPLIPEMDPGEWIQVTVSDTGTGIPPDVLPHIFNPFFTTKAPGEGSGLGLAQVHGIVGQHGGRIDIESHTGEGTTFIIYLPALSAHSTELSGVSELESLTLPTGKGETILVVEDNAIVRKALVESLELLNYRTQEATNGQEALAMLEQHSDDIDLLLSDVVMPGMGGIALLHALKEHGVTVKVVMITGHLLEKELDELHAHGMIDWLPKPPELEELAEVVAQVLGTD